MRTAALTALIGATLALGGCDKVHELTDPGWAKAAAVVARTKAIRSTYAVYNWSRVVMDDGTISQGPSAEFNLGARHRVETPTTRVVADCDTGHGVALQLKEGQEAENDNVGKVACGVSTIAPFDRAEYLGQVDTPYGKADRIRVTTGSTVRTYQIDKDGVILWARFNKDSPEGAIVFDTLGLVLRKDIPTKDMFDRPSLQKAFIPDDVLAELKRQAATHQEAAPQSQ